MSTSAPIDAAASATDASLVTSSASGTTLSNVGNDTTSPALAAHTVLAPAPTSAAISAAPASERASVTSTLRNFGSQLSSESCLSCATSISSSPENATTT